MKSLKILAAIMLLSLGACVTHPNETVSVNTTPPIVAPVADPITPAPVQWKVYNATELEALGKQLQATDANIVLFTLDEIDFKNLSKNLVDIKVFIQQQNKIIDFLTKAANPPASSVKK